MNAQQKSFNRKERKERKKNLTRRLGFETLPFKGRVWVGMGYPPLSPRGRGVGGEGATSIAWNVGAATCRPRASSSLAGWAKRSVPTEQCRTTTHAAIYRIIFC